MAPLTVAVTGGIGAGKSAALAAFARRGVPTLSADHVVHRLIGEDPEVRAALEERLGTTDRAGIAAIVFADREQLDWLEALLHPRVRREQEAWLAGLDARGRRDRDPTPVRDRRRGALRRGRRDHGARRRSRKRTGRAGDARAARLLPDAEKVRRADFAYVNEGTLDELDAFVGQVLDRLTG